MSGQRQAAEKAMAELIAGWEEQRVAPYHLATITLALGDIDQAFVWLERAVNAHDWHVAYVRLDPLLASIRNDPRLLLRKMKLDCGGNTQS
jgi:hypothetical protein